MLMLLPLDKKVDWKHPPVVTILLVFINAVIFYGFQLDDTAIEVEAAQFYLDSGLAKLEAGVYPKYLQQQGNKRLLHQFEREFGVMDSNDDSDYSEYLRSFTDRDYGYKQALSKGAIAQVSQEKLQQIQTKRDLYLAKLASSTYRHYSLRPAETNLVTLFSHMFLHGDNGHLWGNMLFLLIVGYVVEAVLGSWLFLLAYLLTGLGAAGLDIVFRATDYNFHLGASGAISGIMGMYATLFGRRKIQFFYNILFWVGRIQAPAIIMLFIWIAKELIQMIAVDSNVNFLAHLGGLLSGALVAYVLLQWKDLVNTDYMDASENARLRAEWMSDGIQYLGEMKFDQAKRCFIKVLEQSDEDIEAIDYLYKASLPEPASDDFHKYAKMLILASLYNSNFDLMYHTWKAYTEQAQPKPRLGFDCNYWVFEQLLIHNKLADAEKLIIRLFKQNPKNKKISSCFLQLAKKYLALKDKASADKFSKAIVKYYPDSDEAQLARSIISTGNF